MAAPVAIATSCDAIRSEWAAIVAGGHRFCGAARDMHRDFDGVEFEAENRARKLQRRRPRPGKTSHANDLAK